MLLPDDASTIQLKSLGIEVSNEACMSSFVGTFAPKAAAMEAAARMHGEPTPPAPHQDTGVDPGTGTGMTSRLLPSPRNCVQGWAAS